MSHRQASAGGCSRCSVIVALIALIVVLVWWGLAR